ncbi:isocitrate lyase/phosphoenolpyruvate mutase family protein [Cupriavidus sp. IDO]|uniref:isocitrate lyase/phosphoenolpyruvate mutase family protein n=1 Tax=Cupriavidus sp. IDO TaxID=1539142 RepID=UPI003083E1FF
MNNPVSSPKSDGARLRQQLAAPGMLIVPGAYDGIGARLIEQAGFGACYMTGAGTSAARGFPDFGLLTMSEMVENAAVTLLSLAERRWASTHGHHSFHGTASNGMMLREAARSRDTVLHTHSTDTPIRARNGALDTDRRSRPDARRCDSHARYSDDSDGASH